MINIFDVLFSFFYKLLDVSRILWDFLSKPIKSHIIDDSKIINLELFSLKIFDFDILDFSPLQILGGTGLVTLLVFYIVKQFVPLA